MMCCFVLLLFNLICWPLKARFSFSVFFFVFDDLWMWIWIK